VLFFSIPNNGTAARLGRRRDRQHRRACERFGEASLALRAISSRACTSSITTRWSMANGHGYAPAKLDEVKRLYSAQLGA